MHTVTFFSKTWTKGQWPQDDLWPHFCWGHMCDSTLGSLCPSPLKYVNYAYRDFFFKNLNQRSLTPSLLRSRVWLYPRIIVSKFYENTSKYVDTVTFFQKLEPKVFDTYDVWPNVCWCHMCDTWFYPRIIGPCSRKRNNFNPPWFQE